MKIILLSGGLGTRLWPLSTEDYPKQFVKFNFIDKNYKESSLQRIYKQIKLIEDEKNIYFSTNNKLKPLLKEQINTKNIIEEPSTRNTYAALCNIVYYLAYEKDISKDEYIAVVPTDHFVKDCFYKNILKAKSLLIDKEKNICLIGIKPKYNSTKYGYIKNYNNEISSFVEKPDEEKASLLIKENALWNSGIVVAKLGYLLSLVNKELKYKNYKELYTNYDQIEKISFDRKILEKEKNMLIIKVLNKWEDIGTWDSLNKYIKTNDKTKRKWGSYEIIDNFKLLDYSYKIKKLTILKNKNISYQLHHFRKELFNVIDGSGYIIINDKKTLINKGDTFIVEKEEKHFIYADTLLTLIETQIGEVTEETDIERFKIKKNN